MKAVLITLIVAFAGLKVAGCEGRQREEPPTTTDHGQLFEGDVALYMPGLLCEEDQAVASVFVASTAWLHPMGGWPVVIVAVWEDGRVIWSENRSRGGPPYLEGRIDAARVVETLTRVGEAGFYDEPERLRAALPLHMEFETISLVSGDQHATGSSVHELRPELASLRAGFTDDWSYVKNELLGLVPDQGKPVETSFSNRMLMADGEWEHVGLESGCQGGGVFDAFAFARWFMEVRLNQQGVVCRSERDALCQSAHGHASRPRAKLRPNGIEYSYWFSALGEAQCWRVLRGIDGGIRILQGGPIDASEFAAGWVWRAHGSEAELCGDWRERCPANAMETRTPTVDASEGGLLFRFAYRLDGEVVSQTVSVPVVFPGLATSEEVPRIGGAE